MSYFYAECLGSPLTIILRAGGAFAVEFQNFPKIMLGSILGRGRVKHRRFSIKNFFPSDNETVTDTNEMRLKFRSFDQICH